MTAAVETKPIMIPFQSKQALIDEQIRSVQANLLKIKKEKDKQRNDDALRHKARSYHNQLRPKSAVFVDGSGGIRVFLPDSHGTAVDLHKKSELWTSHLLQRNLKKAEQQLTINSDLSLRVVDP
ncbi:hypothetical protein Bca52824_018389 [Brassica carinata]|uniref:Uncharacterized protein n=1 Tax=Brassica carinata TaxID=52824 RepID=A0A8X8AZE2_BRACI|nr:hypothetical protein Bca52824_018389 [Brassica carinata]